VQSLLVFNLSIRRKLRITPLVLLISVSVFAQQRPHYTQYIMNNYILNPAISGIENYIDVKLSARNQWVGLSGAPTTFYATVHGPIGKSDFKTNATSFDMKGENPRGRQYWESYTAAPPHHGIGLTVLNYRTGYINRFTSYATYAYHLGISDQMSLAAGFGAGLSGTSINRSRIELANPIDPAIGAAAGQFHKMTPELNAGLWLYGADFFAGLSAQQIIPVKTNLVDSSIYRSTLVPHIMATAGYRFFISETVTALPSVMTRYIPSMPIYMDLNVKFQYLDRLWLGASYRFKEGYAAMAGVNVSSTFNISYSYDLNYSKYLLGTMHRGTHEIVLGFMLNNGYGDMCPRNVW
jgi:type IX secretion system PorP/SprF family membrane protein